MTEWRKLFEGRLSKGHHSILGVLADAYIKSYEDPTPDWVLWELRRSLEPSANRFWLNSTLLSLPFIGPPTISIKLPLVNFDPHLQDGSRLSLTLLGTSIGNAALDSYAERYLEVLRFAGQRARDLEPPIDKPLVSELTNTDLAGFYQGRVHDLEHVVRSVGRLLSGEMIGRRSCSSGPDFAEFRMSFGSEVADFADVNSLDEYVEILSRRWPFIPTVESEPEIGPFDLHAAIDHFNAVWLLCSASLGLEKKPLFKLSGAEVTARLSHECSTLDGFESRLSGLKQWLDVDLPPGVGGKGPLVVRIAEYLQQSGLLDESASSRCLGAMESIAEIGTLRNAMQHSNALEKALPALEKLGLTLPIANPALAWSKVRSQVINNLRTVREEISSLI
jgi:hypothetical protein